MTETHTATALDQFAEAGEDTYKSRETWSAEDTRGPFKFGIVLKVIDLDSACGEPGFLITAEAAKVPRYLKRKQIEAVKRCGCSNPVTFVDVAEYGICANMDSKQAATREEADRVLEEFAAMAPAWGGMCGFFFDRQANRIGNTGWDFLAGNIG